MSRTVTIVDQLMSIAARTPVDEQWPIDQLSLSCLNETRANTAIQLFKTALENGQLPVGFTLKFVYCIFSDNGVHDLFKGLDSGKSPQNLRIIVTESKSTVAADAIAHALESGQCKPGLTIRWQKSNITSIFAILHSLAKAPADLTLDFSENEIATLACEKIRAFTKLGLTLILKKNKLDDTVCNPLLLLLTNSSCPAYFRIDLTGNRLSPGKQNLLADAVKEAANKEGVLVKCDSIADNDPVGTLYAHADAARHVTALQLYRRFIEDIAESILAFLFLRPTPHAFIERAINKERAVVDRCGLNAHQWYDMQWFALHGMPIYHLTAWLQPCKKGLTSARQSDVLQHYPDHDTDQIETIFALAARLHPTDHKLTIAECLAFATIIKLPLAMLLSLSFEGIGETHLKKIIVLLTNTSLSFDDIVKLATTPTAPVYRYTKEILALHAEKLMTIEALMRLPVIILEHANTVIELVREKQVPLETLIHLKSQWLTPLLTQYDLAKKLFERLKAPFKTIIDERPDFLERIDMLLRFTENYKYFVCDWNAVKNIHGETSLGSSDYLLNRFPSNIAHLACHNMLTTSTLLALLTSPIGLAILENTLEITAIAMYVSIEALTQLPNAELLLFFIKSYSERKHIVMAEHEERKTFKPSVTTNAPPRAALFAQRQAELAAKHANASRLDALQKSLNAIKKQSDSEARTKHLSILQADIIAMGDQFDLGRILNAIDTCIKRCNTLFGGIPRIVIGLKKLKKALQESVPLNDDFCASLAPQH